MAHVPEWRRVTRSCFKGSEGLVQRLVNEVSAFISVVEAQQPLGSKTWNDDDSDNCPKGCASWSEFLV